MGSGAHSRRADPARQARPVHQADGWNRRKAEGELRARIVAVEKDGLRRIQPESEKGERTIAVEPRVAVELWEHRLRSRFNGDDERVFSNPETGSPLDHKRYAATLRLALAKAKVERPMRPFHDGRHTSITNSAAAGLSPAALMARAGHSDFAVTQTYIDLSGELFRAEAELAEQRLFGDSSTKSRYQIAVESPC